MKKQIMLDVATGMKYLHGQNPVIIHRDLKSLNVLIDESWVTKVISRSRSLLVDFLHAPRYCREKQEKNIICILIY